MIAKHDAVGVLSLACIVYGVSLWSVPAAWVVGGVFGCAAAVAWAWATARNEKGERGDP
jgi:uncharacterized membrane protein YbaN (DUF454 family)